MSDEGRGHGIEVYFRNFDMGSSKRHLECLHDCKEEKLEASNEMISFPIDDIVDRGKALAAGPITRLAGR